MKGYEVDVGGDDFESLGGGALQGGIRTGAVNCAAVAEESHGLLAFGTSLGTVELWDPRSRGRVSALNPPTSLFAEDDIVRPEITALDFHRAGLNLATGSNNGIVHTYDLRSPVPMLKKEQGYDFPIQTLKYLTPSSRSSQPSGSSELLLSADKRVIKIWDSQTGSHYTSVEPVADMNHVEWIPDSGMFLTANEGRQQHAFLIPQFGPAPRWCSFLDNLVEEMAEDADDPNSFKNSSSGGGAGEVYDNYTFLDMKQLQELSLDHLIGQTNLLRPSMHGWFVAQKLYEQARLLTNPDSIEQQRQKSIQTRIDKERESRIRGNKKLAVKVNRRLAEKLAAREEANERRKAQRVLKQGGDEQQIADEPVTATDDAPGRTPRNRLLEDDRFKRLFEDEEFEIDETSREFALHNPSSVPVANGERKPRGLTAVEQEEVDGRHGSDDDGQDDESADEDEEAEMAALRARRNARNNGDNEEDPRKRIGASNYKKGGASKLNKFKSSRNEPSMRVSSSTQNFQKQRDRQSKVFGDLASSLSTRDRQSDGGAGRGGVVGEKEVTFAPSKPTKKRPQQSSDAADGGRRVGRGQERRSASGNVFRRM